MSNTYSMILIPAYSWNYGLVYWRPTFDFEAKSSSKLAFISFPSKDDSTATRDKNWKLLIPGLKSVPNESSGSLFRVSQTMSACSAFPTYPWRFARNTCTTVMFECSHGNVWLETLTILAFAGWSRATTGWNVHVGAMAPQSSHRSVMSSTNGFPRSTKTRECTSLAKFLVFSASDQDANPLVSLFYNVLFNSWIIFAICGLHPYIFGEADGSVNVAFNNHVICSMQLMKTSANLFAEKVPGQNFLQT